MFGSFALCFTVLCQLLLSRGEFDLLKKMREFGTALPALVYILNNYGHIDLSTVLIESGFNPVNVHKVAKEWKSGEKGVQELFLLHTLLPPGRAVVERA